MGALMLALWAIRFFAFSLYESPKYLMGKEMDEYAVEVVHRIAQYNRKTSSLSFENLQSTDKEYHKKEREKYTVQPVELSDGFLLYYGVSISKFRDNDLMLSFN